MVHNQLFKPIVLGLILRVNVLIKLEELDQYIYHIRKHISFLIWPAICFLIALLSVPSHSDPSSLGTHCHYLPAISITLETVEKITFPFFASSFSRFISDLVQPLKVTKPHVCGHFNSFVNSPNLQVATFPTYAN